MDTKTTSTSFTTNLEVTTLQEVEDTNKQRRMALQHSQVEKAIQPQKLQQQTWIRTW